MPILLAVLVAGCAGPTAPDAMPTVTATPAAVAPSAAPGRAQAVPVYYVAQTASGLRMYREFHRVQTADPASDAVRELGKAPADPDYRTLWPPAVSLRTPVTSAGGITTVDLAGVADGQVAEDVATF